MAEQEQSPAPGAEGSPKLLAVCVVALVAALVVLAVRFPQMRIDYYLGNIAQSLAYERRIHKADVEALVALGEGIHPELIRQLEDKDTDPGVCVGILLVLDHEKDSEAVTKALRGALDHGHPNVRTTALMRLVKRVPEEGVALVRGRFEKENEGARRVALLRNVAARMEPTAELLGFVAEQVGNDVVEVRLEAVSVLVRLTGIELKLDQGALKAAPEVWKAWSASLREAVKDGKPKALPPFPKTGGDAGGSPGEGD